jgi:hypothetical protein
MAKDIENGGEAAKRAASAEANSELPRVDSPPLSPAADEPFVVPEPMLEPITSPAGDGAVLPLPSAARSHLKLKPRHKRLAVLAASVVLAAAVGAIVGALTARSSAPDDRQVLEQSIDKLNKEIAALKSNVEAGSKSARNQIAKISDKIEERLNRASEPQITGSIATQPTAVPTPPPRPDIRAAVVRDWRIYNVRNGIVAVESHGEIYEIGISAPLPGLGPVEQIKRQDGRWVVMTPRGLIVSQRDRRYFEPN